MVYHDRGAMGLNDATRRHQRTGVEKYMRVGCGLEGLSFVIEYRIRMSVGKFESTLYNHI